MQLISPDTLLLAFFVLSASGLQFISSLRTRRSTNRLLSPQLKPTQHLDVERLLDESSPIRSTRKTGDFVGRYRNRDFVGRVEHRYEDDRETGTNDRSFWIQTPIPKAPVRASIVWDSPLAMTGDRDLATGIATSAVRAFGEPGDMLSIRNGTIGYHGSALKQGARISDLLDLITNIVERIEAADAQVDQLLEETFRTDSDSLARLESFYCLSRRWADQPQKQARLHAGASKDDDFAIRVAAAKIVRDVETLRHIIFESGESTRRRQFALRSLLDILDTAGRDVLLHQLFDSAEPPLCLVGIEEFGKRGPASLVEALDPVRPIFEKELAAPTADAISRYPSTAAIPHLIALAEQTSDWHTQKKAIETMGEVADVGHVAWLRGLGFHEGTVETAVAKIQSRAPGAGGALSVVVPEKDAAGSVSPVPEAIGALSKTPSDV